MKNKVVNHVNDLSKEEQLELFKKYRETLNRDIKNKIIEANMDLVFKISNYYLIDDYYQKEDLISYAYEGLILAVENYNPNLQVDFKVFASEYIKYNILDLLPLLYDFKRGKFFTDFIKIKTIIEKEKCEKLSDNIELVDEILERMIENSMIKRSYYKEHRDKILITLPIYFNHYNYLEFMVNENFQDNIEYESIKNSIKELFYILTKEEELILKLNFGFNDYPKSPKEIAKILNIDIMKVYNIKKIALRKLKRAILKNRINLLIPSSFNLDKYDDLKMKKKKKL